MYKKHPYEERLLAVQKCLEGIPPKTVGRQLGIHHAYVSEWLLLYKQEGAIGLQKRPTKHADFTEKCKIVCEYAEKVYLCTKFAQGITSLRMLLKVGHESFVMVDMRLCVT